MMKKAKKILRLAEKECYTRQSEEMINHSYIIDFILTLYLLFNIVNIV